MNKMILSNDNKVNTNLSIKRTSKPLYPKA